MVIARLNPAETVSVSQMLTAFQSATGMGARVCLAKLAAPLWACENAFCHLLRLSDNQDTPCPAARDLITHSLDAPVVIQRCAAGLAHVALAVAGPTGVAGWIESGQVLLSPPRRGDFTGFCQRFPGRRSSAEFVQLEAAFFATPVLTRERIEAGTVLLRLLIRELEPFIHNPDLIRSGPALDPVEKAKRYILRNLSEQITLSSLAKHVALSTAYLCRLFKRQTGCSLGSYVSNARVERAKRFLAQADSRAVDTAYAAGFQSVRQFNHVFKTRTRLTPSQYRRSYGSAANTACGPVFSTQPD